MKLFLRLFAIWLSLGCAQIVWAQAAGPKIDRVDIKFVGPATVSEQFVRVNIRAAAGDTYKLNSTQDDVHALYATGQFYNIRVAVDQSTNSSGVILTYVVQARPRITEIKIEGNDKVSDSKIKKKITVKVGDALDEQKLFTDVQDIKKLYEKYGYADTQVKYVTSIDENAGHGTVTFEITETHKVKIQEIDFIGAAAFTQSELRKVIKLKRHWMWSWLTGNGVFKQDDFDDDNDLLGDFYRSHGYLDFEVKNVRMENPTTNTLVIRYYLYEGHQYKVGSIKLTGNKIFSNAEIKAGMEYNHSYQNLKGPLGTNGFAMDVGNIYTPDGLRKDTVALEDFYGGKGYIDVEQGTTLRVIHIPNIETGTMDLEFQIDEGQKTYVEKINITGNVKTKDSVIRRELAISPGEVFDMVQVKISKQRLEGLQYFDKVDTDPAPTDPPISGHKNLDINVNEKNTGSLTFGAGFSSVDSLVGFVEMSQGNFDLFHPPTFTGAGQKLRIKLALGTERRDYEVEFIEPWFLNRKLSLDISLYRHELDFESPNDIFDETQTGARVTLSRALWTDFFIGSVYYDVENVGISLNSPYFAPFVIPSSGSVANTNYIPQHYFPYTNTPSAIVAQTGDHTFSRFGTSLAYDTRNSVQLPNHGQRTEIDPEISVGYIDYYKIQLKSAWYFPGLMKGHVIEAVGRTGIAGSIAGGDVPFNDAYYLGGLYSLRGYKFRNVSPRDPNYNHNNPFAPGNPYMPNEPIGGDSYWFGSVEYSIPIVEKDGGISVRVAAFFDAGAVGDNTFSFDSGLYDDDVGLGLRINIPHLGPLRLDYAVPINHDQYNGGSGQFQFGAGYTRQF
jgi:outer membrane protein insertion porin family